MSSLDNRTQAHRALAIEAACDRIAWTLGYDVKNPEAREPEPAYDHEETGVYRRPIHLQNRPRASLELCCPSAEEPSKLPSKSPTASETFSPA